ncbi:MAG: hypothetical protein JWM59_245 [Verrucomicrobiales bacterium]|nr:hypothetical protein [Verrucomicrobiales bacterium]
MSHRLLTFLDSLRSPLASMAGLPVESVAVYAQQDMAMHIAGVIARHRCAVMMGFSGLEIGGKADIPVPGPPVDATLEITVWTPEVVLQAGGPLAMDVAECIIAGLHGRRPPEGAPGMALVPRFRSASIISRTGGQGTARHLVATLIFKVPVCLRPSRPLASSS